jgi:uncharacterized protein (TIGR00369 family)
MTMKSIGAAPNPNYVDELGIWLQHMPYWNWLGLSLRRVTPGEADVLMPFREEVTFDGQYLQAGPVGSLLDFAGGAAAFTLAAPGVVLSTIDFTIKLLAPASGEGFLGQGRVISTTRSRTIARADVFSCGPSLALGQHVATGLVTMHLTLPSKNP